MRIRGRNVRYFSFKAWDWPWLCHAFSSRVGGVSTGPWWGLNLGGRCGDTDENVAQNRHLFLAALGFSPAYYTYGKQVHGDKVVVVDKQVACLQGVDGLLTKRRGLPLLAFFADCLPLFLVVPTHKIVGIIHAGWRGTMAGIAQKAVQKIVVTWNVKPADIHAGLGPAIGSCCYEVDRKRAKQLEQKVPLASFALTSGRFDHFFLDLALLNTLQLKECGVPKENTLNSNLCTACHPHFFYSYRRCGGKTGRMTALIALREVKS